MNIYTYHAFAPDQFVAEYPVLIDNYGRIRTYESRIFSKIVGIPTHYQSLLPEQYNYYGWDNSDFVENCVVILNRHWVYDFFTNEKRNLEHIKNKKIIIMSQENCFVNKTGNDSLLIVLKEFLHNTNFDLKNVYIITQLHADIDRIHQYLPECNVHVFDGWLDEFMWFEGDENRYVVENENLQIENTKRFSIFCRRINQRRFHFYCGLLVNDILTNSYYTFGNLSDSLADRYTNEDIKNMISESMPKNLIEDWIQGIPYEIEAGLINHLHAPETSYPSLLKTMFEKSCMHIIQETNPIEESNIISEKTYKSIFYKKPFLLLGQPKSLELLKVAGYKTFDNVIDESYDSIEDYDLRAEAILKEITRLNNLSDTEWRDVIMQCEAITEHNYNRLKELVNEPWPNSFTISGMSQF